MTDNSLPTHCMHCSCKTDSVLELIHYKRGEHLSVRKCTQNVILFMMKGEILFNSQEYPGTTLRQGDCILQPINSKIELLALTDAEYIVYHFTEFKLLCEERYKKIISMSQAPNTYSPLTILPPLNHALLSAYPLLQLKETCHCTPYIELKIREITFLLINLYSEQQLSLFFYPISTYTETFQYFVMQNYMQVKNVEEFARLGGYNVNTFRRLFRNVYGAPVYEWVLNMRRMNILEDLATTRDRIGTIGMRYGFDSLSHFAHFCKDSFDDTPRSLRKRALAGEDITLLYKPKKYSDEGEEDF